MGTIWSHLYFLAISLFLDFFGVTNKLSSSPLGSKVMEGQREGGDGIPAPDGDEPSPAKLFGALSPTITSTHP